MQHKWSERASGSPPVNKHLSPNNPPTHHQLNNAPPPPSVKQPPNTRAAQWQLHHTTPNHPTLPYPAYSTLLTEGSTHQANTPTPTMCVHAWLCADNNYVKKGVLRSVFVALTRWKAACTLASTVPGSSPSTSSTLPSRAHNSSCWCWSNLSATCLRGVGCMRLCVCVFVCVCVQTTAAAAKEKACNQHRVHRHIHATQGSTHVAGALNSAVADQPDHCLHQPPSASTTHHITPAYTHTHIECLPDSELR